MQHVMFARQRPQLIAFFKLAHDRQRKHDVAERVVVADASRGLGVVFGELELPGLRHKERIHARGRRAGAHAHRRLDQRFLPIGQHELRADPRVAAARRGVFSHNTGAMARIALCKYRYCSLVRNRGRSTEHNGRVPKNNPRRCCCSSSNSLLARANSSSNNP